MPTDLITTAKRIVELSEKATPGPWGTLHGDRAGVHRFIEPDDDDSDEDGQPSHRLLAVFDTPEDEVLTAALRNDAPALAKALLEIKALVYPGLYSPEWIAEHKADDHMCKLDHKDEIEYAELIEALLGILHRTGNTDE